MSSLSTFRLNNRAFIWNFLFAVTLGLNILNFRAVDLIFTVIALLGIATTLKDKASIGARFFIKKNLLNIFICLFLFFCALGYFLQDLSDQDVTEILELRWILGFYISFYLGQQIRRDGGRLWIGNPFFLLGILIMLGFHWAHANAIFGMAARLQGFYSNPNHLGLALVAPCAFYVGYTTIKKEWSNKTEYYLSLATLALLLMSVFATFSRTSWMGVIAAAFIGMFFSKNRKLTITVAGMAALFTLGFSQNIFGLKDRILYSFDTSLDGNTGSRLVVWKVNWQIFLDHPLTGVGIEKSSRLYPEYYERMGFPESIMVGNAHNQYLQILSGAGIFGLLFYIGIFSLGAIYFINVFRKQVGEERALALAALLAIVGLFFSSFTDTPFRLQECRNYILFIMGCSAGFLYLPSSNSKENSSNEK